MKITIVLGAFFPVPPIMGGAVEKVWFQLGKEFVRRGHEVVQISRRHPDLPERETINGVTHIRVKSFDQPRSILWLKLLDLVYSWRVHRILPQADILVTNTFWLPIIQRGCDHGLVHVHVARGPKGQMRFYTHVARLLAVSSAIANAIERQIPEVKQKVRVIPNPVPFRIADKIENNRSRTILFVGRIHPEKGIELLLRAMSLLPAEVGSVWTLRIVGPHETRLGGGGEDFLRAMKTLAGNCAIPVEWVGAIFDETQLEKQYQSSMIFVYPSVAQTGEAMPVAPLEAMANGSVPLVSNLDCFRDYIRDGTTGFVFDGSEEALAKRLRSALSLDNDAFLTIASSARAKAAEFAIEHVAELYLKDFAGLLTQTE